MNGIIIESPEWFNRGFIIKRIHKKIIHKQSIYKVTKTYKEKIVFLWDYKIK